jgi:phenylalanyl-tRNA synthetase beta chain
LIAGRDLIGSVGEVDPEVAAVFGVTERVAVLELDLGRLLGAEARVVTMKPVSRAPSSDLDLAFELVDEVPAERLEKALRQGAGALLADLDLFDVYRGEGIAPGSRSLAYRLRLQAADRTLTDRDISDIRDKCVTAANRLGAVLRG